MVLCVCGTILLLYSNVCICPFYPNSVINKAGYTTHRNSNLKIKFCIGNANYIFLFGINALIYPFCSVLCAMDKIEKDRNIIADISGSAGHLRIPTLAIKSNQRGILVDVPLTHKALCSVQYWYSYD